MSTNIDVHNVVGTKTQVRVYDTFQVLEVVVAVRDIVTGRDHDEVTLTLYLQKDGLPHYDSNVYHDVIKGLVGAGYVIDDRRTKVAVDA